MRRLTLATFAAIWASTALVSAQSQVPMVYRLFEFMRSRQAPTGTEQDRPAGPMPRTWDDQAVASLQVPLAVASASPVQVSSTYYYARTARAVAQRDRSLRRDVAGATTTSTAGSTSASSISSRAIDASDIRPFGSFARQRRSSRRREWVDGSK